MNVMSNISEDRKHLLEKRMLNQDQHQYPSPQQQQHQNNVKNSVLSASKSNEETRSTVADSTASLSISHGNIDTKTISAPPLSLAAVDNVSVAATAIDSSTVLKPSSQSIQISSTSGTVAPIIEELLEIDELKTNDNSRSNSRSTQSPALKSEKDKENKMDPNMKSSKRQSNGSFENRSPKLAKHEENHHDQSAAINQG
jgi:hypothetical protein